MTMIQSVEQIDTLAPGVTRHMVYKLKNGSTIHAKCLDPYGMWKLNYDKGPLPEYLSGDYTSLSEVEKAITYYASKKADKFEGSTV
jgi:hypothetical protein